MYGLPHSSLDRIAPFFRLVEKMKADHDADTELEDDDDQPLIRDCSISHTSMKYATLPPQIRNFVTLKFSLHNSFGGSIFEDHTTSEH
mgnify:CR=1 FL=1